MSESPMAQNLLSLSLSYLFNFQRSYANGSGAHKHPNFLDSILSLDELRVPPGNRLETLSGQRKGQSSIRINDQFRICFKWSETGPVDVEITDYH
jgi:plasmid maintenance system killer protein